MNKTKPNKKKINQVFRVLRKEYETIPLEVFESPYEILISTLMSSRTNDDTTLPAAKRLFRLADSFQKLSKLSTKKIQDAIYPVGFYKVKAKNIKQLAKIVLTDYSGKVPDTREELMQLPGVGRKTANLVLNRAFGKPAIAVDTHVHKITNWLGWVKTKSPEDTEKELTYILPRKYRSETNRLFVSLGRKLKTENKIKEFLKEKKLTYQQERV